MVKYIYIILALTFFISCIRQSKISYSDCSFQIGVEKNNLDTTDVLKLYIKNNSKNEFIEIGKPNYLANTVLHLYDSLGNEIKSLLLIHVNQNNKYDFIRIEKSVNYNYSYDYKLNKLFKIHKGGNYKLRINYIGNMRLENRIYKKMNCNFWINIKIN